MTFLQFAYRNVFRNFRNYAAFFMASFFSVFVFFIYSMLMFHPEIERGFLGEVSIAGMVFAEIVLVLFSWFFIFYSMRAFLEARSKEFAILLHLGMDRNQLGKLIIIETMTIGIFSCISGIVFGFAFSKFFFMIVREILNLNALPLYLSWEPFVLTLFVYLSAFVVISTLSTLFTPDIKIRNFIRGPKFVDAAVTYSKRNAILGIILILCGYGLALITTKSSIFSYTLLIPVFVTLGTYYFFTDTTLYIIDRLKGRKQFYWKKARMLAIAEQVQILRFNSRMFFIVTLVSTLAFLTVGVLSAMSSYTSQYDKINPIGLLYKGEMDNPYEIEHILSVIDELEFNGISYHMTRFTVMRQTSSYTSNPVEVFRETDINHLLFSYKYPLVNLKSGEAMFIPYSEDSIEKLEKTEVKTVLKENNVDLTINSVYPKMFFPTAIISSNSIIISDEDFEKLKNEFEMSPYVEPGYHLFTFDIPNWTETENIGIDIQQMVARDYLINKEYTLPFYFENAGLNYSYILATYSLLTLIGILVVAVFLLASGSFVYFKIYANLDREKKQFDMLVKVGLSGKELKRLITRNLMIQFFLPWGLAFVHSAFAFYVVQTVLNDVMNLSIVKEVVFSFTMFALIQIVYFFLIRWRYISHVRG
ncbi:FtsX-like permease family protein [Solibacillus isronensis B3W22]|uniref:FtsX-like permease family protein n=1 Tax=Solibacillus isronensis B3W22 TaxID=1224748 RepID=K1L2P4_9BACL|nr:ABC transporter permease [Solibacillus isronensis]AMO86844.1 ABC transporter permease [Solibacillus silvestris]EKB44898.1 FtsX-like permease family protein [Solibacillus isronensis B3W22]